MMAMLHRTPHRHPGESRDPTIRVTAFAIHRAETWVPAFAGMTKLNCPFPRHAEAETEVTP